MGGVAQHASCPAPCCTHMLCCLPERSQHKENTLCACTEYDDSTLAAFRKSGAAWPVVRHLQLTDQCMFGWLRRTAGPPVAEECLTPHVAERKVPAGGASATCSCTERFAAAGPARAHGLCTNQGLHMQRHHAVLLTYCAGRLQGGCRCMGNSNLPNGCTSMT